MKAALWIGGLFALIGLFAGGPMGAVIIGLPAFGVALSIVKDWT